MNQTCDQSPAGTAPTAPAGGGALATAERWVAARWDALGCALVLALMCAAMLDTLSRKSITVDETVMIPAAFYHVAEREFRLVHEHPPLSKILAALPLLAIQGIKTLPPDEGGTPGTPAWKDARTGRFWPDNTARFRRICFWARVPAVALTAALGLLVFAFARDLFGKAAAVCAVALYAVEPTVLAHGRVVQTDVPAAFGYLLTVYAVYRYLKRRTAAGALAAGAAAGAAALAKFSMLLVGPALAVLFAALFCLARRLRLTRAAVVGHAALAALALLACVWAAYFFHSRALTEVDLGWVAASFPERAETVARAAGALSHVFPTDFVLGALYQLWHAGEGHQASLLGMYSATGWWYYFPVAFALKTTLPFLLLSLASLGWGAYLLARRRDRRFLFLLVPYGVYTAYVMASPINIGVRYYLPAYPFLFVAGGALLSRLLTRRGAGRTGRLRPAAAALLLCWAAAEAVRTYPHYMSYMNQLAVGRPHWWYLSDSNVEWGDDVRALSLYLRRRGERRVRAAALAGWVTTGFYGVEYVNALVPEGTPQPPTRYTAIGASFLNGSTVPPPTVNGRPATEQERVNFFAAYRERTPEKIFGDSIYLFREDR